MALPSISEGLDNLYTTTWQNMKNKVADQVFDGSPFWFWLRDKGKLKTQEGGKWISEPLRFAKSERIKYIGRGGTVVLSDQEFLSVATYEWRYLTDSIVRFGVDDQQNRGKHEIINLMNAKLDTSKDSLADEMELSLFDDDGSRSTDALAFNSLKDIVADDPTTGTVGGIDRSTNSWWQNQFKDMAGLSFAVHGNIEMRTMFNNCGKNLKGQFPDIIVSGQTPYERYEDSVQEQKRITNQKLGDAMFENIQFKGIPMVWSPGCANTRMYFLNTGFFSFTYDPAMFFDMTEWKPIPDQVNDKAAQVITAGNLVSGRLRVHGVLFNLDTN